MLICDLHNPAKNSYREIDLMNYIISFVDFVLSKHPEAALVCGGDANLLEMVCLAGISWLISPHGVTRAWITADLFEQPSGSVRSSIFHSYAYQDRLCFIGGTKS